jgi:hypothetical protein
MMRRGLWIAVGVVVVIVLAGLLVFGSYVSARNQMVAKQEGVQEAWSNVQSQLQRRADLIPNLVATVKGYATHEETVFGEVDQERERYNSAIRDYNTYIRQFPNNIWAHIAGFQPNNNYFEASPASQAAPQVKF